MKYKRCQRCGGCCSDLLPMTRDEVDRIRDYVGRRPRKLRQPDNPTRCLFLRHTLGITRCSIYPVRPEICRIYNCSVPTEELEKEWNRSCEGREVRSMYEAMYS